jgi:hypothetical protein
MAVLFKNNMITSEFNNLINPHTTDSIKSLSKLKNSDFICNPYIFWGFNPCGTIFLTSGFPGFFFGAIYAKKQNLTDRTTPTKGMGCGKY